MPRSTHTFTFAADAVTVEGTLIAPAMLARVAAQQANGQSETEYRIPKGLTLRDEVARYFRIGQALFSDLNASPTPSTEKTIAFVEALLRDVFCFADIARVGMRSIGGRHFTVTLEGLGGRVPIVIVPPADELDRPSGHLQSDNRRRSAASAVQDWLNANEATAWGLCCNGVRLRLLRDNASLTRPAYIEADLRRIFEGEAFADFSMLWLLLHASRFGATGTPPLDNPLERWREAGQREGLAARDRLRDGVEATLLALGTGFLGNEHNGQLRERVRTGVLRLPEFFGQLLRLVYRLIFLLAAEDRDLLHPPGASASARKLYAEGYSLAMLRDRAIRRMAWDQHHDRWEGLLITFAALTRGEPRLGLPALDGLFAAGTIPDLETARLSNRALIEAVYRLAWMKEPSGLISVNWRDMETEELGSVYESLLELTPRLTDDGRAMIFAEGGEAKGHARKTTGSYYTPDSLVQALLDSALNPVLDQIEAEANDPAQALIGVTVIDPACGSGHFLLAAARRIATRLARARAGGVASAGDFRHALRDVARSCIHGVDRNPMAVELTKVALWIETVEPGKPLGFLDANVRCGDALLGVFDIKALVTGIPDAAYKPLTGDDKATARYYAARNRDELRGQGSLDFGGGRGKLPPAPPLAAAARGLRALPEDDVEQIAVKRRRFEAARADPLSWAWKVACDLYVAAFLIPKTGGEPANRNTVTIPTTGHVWQRLAGGQPYGPLVARAQDLAAEARAFHWPLEFPDVMTAGGFDVVLGNPPWERIKLQEQEFFASRDTDIATAPNAAARGRLIVALREAEPGTREHALFEAFETAKRLAEASSVFARESGRFPLTGRGDVNTYALFAELFAISASPRGRSGVIVPTGIATDTTTAPFFAALIEGRRLFSLHDFQTGLGFFDRIGHARFKFCLMTVGRPNSAPKRPAFSFFSRTANEFSDRRRHFSLSQEEIARMAPNTLTAPTFRTQADADLTASIHHRVPVLIDEVKGAAGNPWGMAFMTMFHMSNDSGLFRMAEQLHEAGFTHDGSDWVLGAERYVPLYEAKMIHQFDHRWATYQSTDSRDATEAEKKDPDFEPAPRYWLPAREVNDRLASKRWTKGWLMGWRDICRSTDERTVIATAFPRVGVGHTTPLLFVDAHPIHWAALCANLNALVLDYVARQKIGGTHLTYGYLQQFPVLPPSAYSESHLAFIVPRVLELIYTSHAMAPFARDLGCERQPFAWNEDRRAHLRSELDAFYARIYALTRDELRYVLDPEDAMGVGYPSETFRVLKSNEIRRFGEYRTARLVLDAWDRTEGGEIGAVARAIAVSTGLPVPIDLAALPDGAWARLGQPQPGDIGAALTAILKAMDGPRPIHDIRVAAALVLEPRLLAPPLLSEAATAEWRRLVGLEANPLPDNAAAFAPRINAVWGGAVRNHRGNGRLIEDLAGGTWAPGPGLEAVDTIGWPDGRASFVMKNVDLGTASNSLPSEIQRWIADVATA